jgi:tRNA dimethylallyltransferase
LSNKQPLLILVVGPTASGKTALAIQLAEKFNTVVVSADSRQFYKELPIGTAMPDAQQLAQIQHYFIADRSLHQHLNAGAYEVEANALLNQLFQKHSIVIACGGSGLFLKALVDGFDAIAPRSVEVRTHWQNVLAKEGIAALQEAVKQQDPVYAATADMQNHQRLIRALEVMEVSGLPYSAQRTESPKKRPYRCLWIGLNPDRALLHERIHQRVDAMLAAGLVDEARAVWPYKEAEALKTVGYVELFAHFEGLCSLAEACEQIKTNTRQYARRQMTWFRKNPDIHWFEAPCSEIEQLIEKLSS